MSDAKLSPKSRGIANLKDKIERLKQYEKWREVKVLNYEKMVGKELWRKHWQNLEKLHDDMVEAQIHAKKLREAIAKTLAGT